MCLGTCGKIFVSILTLIFFACVLIGTILPLFRNTDSSVTLFQLRNSTGQWNDKETYDLNASGAKWIKDQDCKSFREQFMAAEALAVVAIVFSAVAFVLSIVHYCVKCCGPFVATLLFICFACEVVVFALVLNGWFNGYCKDEDDHVTAFRDRDFKLVEGFALHVAAAGGFLISAIIEAAV